MIQIYGIPTCGSVKKAIAWAREAGVEFTFHNFRTEAPTDELLSGWLKDIPAAKLANTAGPTWRKIDPEIREAAKANPDMLKTNPHAFDAASHQAARDRLGGRLGHLGR